ncbi:MAG TPA: tetratricopeptide repeat protein, partial [Longimicrobiales bacterium]|nr:tetratricopeptide repeat protein [Longimicrobiales bacterium]
MKGLGAALAGVTAVLTGCTYYNAVYNAERLYEQAESDLRAGRDSLAELRYREVARRTAEAYRADPAGERAGELLLLLGRAQLRTGEVRAAQLALEEALAREQDPELRPRILVDLGRALLRGGDPEGALARADEALELAPEEPVRAEAFLLRGSALLARGPGEEGWGDLERAAAAGGEVRVEAGLERLAAAVRHGRRQQAREAIATLL